MCAKLLAQCLVPGKSPVNVRHQYDADGDDNGGDDDADDDDGRISLNCILNTWLWNLDNPWTLSFLLHVYNAYERGETNQRAGSKISNGRK